MYNEKEIAEFEEKYGTVYFEGKKYTLTQEAYIDGLNGGVAYFAAAVGENEKEVTVMWNTTTEWDEREKLYRESNYTNMLYVNDDAADACDWNNPVNVYY